MKRRLCFVVQRYGKEINGGAESYTKTFAEKLAAFYDITVLTTCAADYSDWADSYPEGSEVVDGVLVHRFKTDRLRTEPGFSDCCGKIFGKAHSTSEANDWVCEQGPVSEGLIKFIRENKNSYELFLFFTYLYYPAVFGIKEVKEKSVLIPFCHDEPPVYLKCYDELFTSPQGIIYNTDEEKAFVLKRFGITDIPSITAGIGIDVDFVTPDVTEHSGSPYILYMGRVDKAKGCHELFDFFKEYKKRFKNDLKLCLTGKEIMKLPESIDIISHGFVTEEEKYRILTECEALVLPSHYESLSIVVLEAFAYRKPVLVSGHSEVLKGHCLKSNGGLYFYGKEDFCSCLELLMENKKLRYGMGENGFQYVKENYSWDNILKKVTGFLDMLMK